MQGYRVLEESIIYTAGKYDCELQFIRCTESNKLYPLYDLELTVDGATTLDLYKQSQGEARETFKLIELRRIVPATVEALDDWCQRHPYTFVSFFDCLTGLYRIYFKLGFVSDGRVETFIAFVNTKGERTTFKGMLNLLSEDDFWVNDIWRVAKDGDYYLGDRSTPVDLFAQILSEAGIPFIRASNEK